MPYNPQQPRLPAGSKQGGRYTTSGTLKPGCTVNYDQQLRKNTPCQQHTPPAQPPKPK